MPLKNLSLHICWWLSLLKSLYFWFYVVNCIHVLLLCRNKSRGTKTCTPTQTKEKRVRISFKICKTETRWMNNTWPGIPEKSKAKMSGGELVLVGSRVGCRNGSGKSTRCKIVPLQKLRKNKGTRANSDWVQKQAMRTLRFFPHLSSAVWPLLSDIRRLSE